MPLDAGDLWARITIEQPSSAQNEVGESTLTWTTYATVWADVQPLGGREAQRYAETVGLSTHRVTLRYLSGLTSSMRVSYDGRTLEIGQVNERERKWIHELICTEKVAT
ncbi:MAG: head-tail adaptor protein [Caulobacteraceae bacterium]|nr:head-tail adaptor protein [Caulobacteraceae bacterium]